MKSTESKNSTPINPNDKNNGRNEDSDPTKGLIIGSPQWQKPQLLMLLITGCVLVSFFPTFLDVFALWNDLGDDFGHGWLVGGICLYLMISTHLLVTDDTNPPALKWLEPLQPLFLLAALAAGTIIILGQIAGILIVQVLVLPPLIWCLFAGIFGPNAALKLIPATAYLYFALPIWDNISAALQSMTAWANAQMLGLVEIPHMINGNRISIPSGTFEVASGCSGVKYFISSSAIAALFGLLYCRYWSSRILVLMAGMGTAVLLNWIRVMIIIVVGHETEMQHELVTDHNDFGWVLYAGSLIPFYFVAIKVMQWDQKRYLESVNTKASNIQIQAITQLPPFSKISLALGVALAPTLLFIAFKQQPFQIEQTQWTPGKQWHVSYATASTWQPNFLNANLTQTQSYFNAIEDITVDTHILTYFDQNQERELINYLNSIAGEKWRVSDNQQHLSDQGYPAKFTETIVENRKFEKVIILHWYQLGDYVETSEVKIKLRQILRFIERKDGAELLAVAARCASDCKQARQSIKLFLKQLSVHQQ